MASTYAIMCFTQRRSIHPNKVCLAFRNQCSIVIYSVSSFPMDTNYSISTVIQASFSSFKISRYALKAVIVSNSCLLICRQGKCLWRDHHFIMQQHDDDDKDPVLLLLISFSTHACCIYYREPLTMSTQVLNEVFSDPFTVYTPKTFPGMTGLEERGSRGEIKGLSRREKKSVRERGHSLYMYTDSSLLLYFKIRQPCQDLLPIKESSCLYAKRNVSANWVIVSMATRRTISSYSSSSDRQANELGLG